MKILLDECVPKRFKRAIVGHTVFHATEMGWATIKNGKLLALAEGKFDVFVTVDRNLSFQQHLLQFNIAVIVLRARSNRLTDLKLLVPDLCLALPKCKPRRLIDVGGMAAK